MFNMLHSHGIKQACHCKICNCFVPSFDYFIILDLTIVKLLKQMDLWKQHSTLTAANLKMFRPCVEKFVRISNKLVHRVSFQEAMSCIHVYAFLKNPFIER